MHSLLIIAIFIFMTTAPGPADAACALMPSGDFNCGESGKSTPKTSTTEITSSPLMPTGPVDPVFSPGEGTEGPGGKTAEEYADIAQKSQEKLDKAFEDLCPANNVGDVNDEACNAVMDELQGLINSKSSEEIANWDGDLVAKTASGGATFMGVAVASYNDGNRLADVELTDEERAEREAESAAEAERRKAALEKVDKAFNEVCTGGVPPEKCTDAQLQLVKMAESASTAEILAWPGDLVSGTGTSKTFMGRPITALQ